MVEKRPTKPFSLAKSKERVVRDKDNAAPRIKPPEQINLPHPRLAPPGMSGIKPGAQPGLPLPSPQSPRPMLDSKDGGRVARAFKPLVQNPEKSQERGR